MWLAAQPGVSTLRVSAVVDVEARKVLDLLEGRNASDLAGWLADRDPARRAGVQVATCDLHEPFRAAFNAELPHTTQVSDPFHVIGVSTRVIDRTRRGIQMATCSGAVTTRSPTSSSRRSGTPLARARW